MKVVIEKLDGAYHIVDESGKVIEPDFDSYEEAEEYALDNDMELEESFVIQIDTVDGERVLSVGACQGKDGDSDEDQAE